jgi:hypothetical protein
MKAVDDLDLCPLCERKIGLALPKLVDGELEWCCSSCTLDVVIVP